MMDLHFNQKLATGYHSGSWNESWGGKPFCAKFTHQCLFDLF